MTRAFAHIESKFKFDLLADEISIIQKSIENIYDEYIVSERYNATINITNYGSIYYIVHDYNGMLINYNRRIHNRYKKLDENTIDKFIVDISVFIDEQLSLRYDDDNWFIKFFTLINDKIEDLLKTY